MSKIKEVPNPTLECIGCIFKDSLQCLNMACLVDKDNPIKYIEVDEDINENNMNKKVSEFVRKYAEEHLDKSDSKQVFEVYVVWQCYILGNAKWLLSTTLPDGMYYEVTYNKAKDEFYLDAYKKFENRCIPNK
mgnify:FL=1|jgi:hypothetical protein|nr:MAG TPA: hypothetical protein [Crassvirales sp.]